jgi:hypothetical protein
MEEYLVVTPRGTYRVPLDTDDAGTLIDLLDFYVSKGTAFGPDRLRAMSRQQVLAQLGRPTLPEDKDTPFPDSAVIIGDENGDGAFTRGWLAWQISTWQDARMRAKMAADGPEASAAGALDGSAGSGQAQPAAEDVHGDATAENDEPESGSAVVSAASGSDDAGQEQPPSPVAWTRGSRQWEAAGSADERVVIVTSHGIVSPSGWVQAGPPPSAADIQRFILWHWRKKPPDMPLLFFTAEAMDRLGMDVEDADPDDVANIVAETFGCKVSWSQSGYFTCRWGAAAVADDADTEVSSARSASLAFLPWLPLNPSDARPGDLGVAGIEGQESELPEDEDEAAPILAERIAWLCDFGPGVMPGPRWSTVGAAYADVKRRASSIKQIKPGTLPGEVTASQSDLDPDMHEGKRPHKAKSDHIIVETDQRAAYLASAGQLFLGYGEPSRVEHPDADVLSTQRPPFGLWRVTTPAGKSIDGMDMRLPMPNGYMSRDEQRTFWTTTRGAQHLISSVDVGGTGLTAAELQIDAAWVWPHQSQLLRQWAAGIRDRLTDAIAEGRTDREAMLKAMYKAYLGRTRSDKWSPRQGHHHQPAHYASIQADVRWRALKFAVRIKDEYGWYPAAADVDAWIYWLPAYIECPDCDGQGCEQCNSQGRKATDPSVLEEPTQFNGKYRIKDIERPGQMPGSQQQGA